MAAIYNSVYEQVRKLGLPYEIKESGGSVTIKISAEIKQESFYKKKEQFRFHTKRTLNGASSSDWKNPLNNNEKSVQISSSFPNLQFFQTTPPPQRPPPLSALPTSSPPPSTTPESLVSPNHTSQILPQFSSTPVFNPYRCQKRKIEFPKTPSLLKPSSPVILEMMSSSSNLVNTALFSLESPATHSEFPDDNHFPPANLEPFIKVMKAIYEGTASGTI